MGQLQFDIILLYVNADFGMEKSIHAQLASRSNRLETFGRITV
jgi:hypothetical protein